MLKGMWHLKEQGAPEPNGNSNATSWSHLGAGVDGAANTLANLPASEQRDSQNASVSMDEFRIADVPENFYRPDDMLGLPSLNMGNQLFGSFLRNCTTACQRT